MSKIKLFLSLLFATLIITAGDVLPTQAQSRGRESQVAFFAGNACRHRRGYSTSCYINQLEVKGFNQHDKHSTWRSQWSNSERNSLATYNWWWNPQKTISLKFHIKGYGWRKCSIRLNDDKYFAYLHIRYEGNNSCKFEFDSPHRW